MREDLGKLDSYLEEKRNEFYLQLEQPLGEDKVKGLESKYDLILPGDLKELYSWKNGQSIECSEAFVNNSMFIPLEEALEIAEELTAMIGSDFETENWWNEHWIPIFQNGGGDYICYDTKGIFTGNKGQLIEFWHADSDRNVVASSLESFIKEINQYYKSTRIDDFDEFFCLD